MKRLSVRAALAAGPAVLLVHLLVAAATPPVPEFDKYGAAARQRLAGTLPSERLIDFSPLYLELATLAEATSPDPASSLRILQLLAAAATASGLALWLRRRLPRGVLVAVLAVFALDRGVLVYTNVLEPEILLLALVVAFLAALDRAPLAAGCAAALAVALRPTVLPLVALGPLDDRLRRGRWAPLRRLAAWLVPSALLVVALAGRAAVATGQLRTPAMNPGTVFYEGNQPLSAGTSAAYPRSVLELIEAGGAETSDIGHVLYREIARAIPGPQGPRTIVEVNSYWAGLGRAWLGSSPSAAAARVSEKLRRALHGFAWHDLGPAWKLDRVLPVPGLPFGFLVALALLGLVGEARRFRRSLLPFGLFFSQLAVQLVFYTSPRQRLLWLPALLFFAARGWVALASLPPVRRLAGVALVGTLAFGSLLPDPKVLDERYRRTGELQAEHLLLEVRRQTANGAPVAGLTPRLADAVAAAPWWLEPLEPAFVPREERSFAARVADRLEDSGPSSSAARFDLARVQLLAGRFDRAGELFGQLLDEAGETPVHRQARHSSSVRFHLARLAARRGDAEEAVALLLEARRENPGEPWVLADLAVLAGDAGARADLERFWGPVDAAIFLGRAAVEAGRDREAVELLTPWVRRLPDLREVRLELAVALGRTGSTDEAVREVLAANAERVQPVVRPQEIAAIVRRWRAERPEDPRRAVAAAQLLAGNGFFTEAGDALSAAVGGAEPQDLRLAAEISRTRALLGGGEP